MASFTYVAREAGTNREIRSSIDASSEQAAIAALLNRNLLVVSIQEKIGKRGRTAGGSVALADLVMFTRQLATMIDAGLAMVQSLQALAEQTTNKVMRDVIKDVCTRVEGGDSFSQALVKHPKVFTRLYVSMVDAGEKGGLLAEVMARLATYLENTARLRKKVISAMMYPTIVTIIAIAITTFLLLKVVPVFGDIYSGFGAQLPGPTQFLIDLSKALQRNFLFTTEVHLSFTYVPRQVFTFYGDDDLWIFVNGRLALDLGGVHTALAGQVTLPLDAGGDTNAEFSLTVGNIYEIVVFQAERWCCDSNYNLALSDFIAGESTCCPD